MTQMQNVIVPESNEALGNTGGIRVYWMECQQRGLPHAHILLYPTSLLAHFPTVGTDTATQ